MMSNVRVYTNDGRPNGHTPVQGSKVFVGDTQLEEVLGLELVAELNGVWKLRLSVAVDPNKLFSPLPAATPIDKKDDSPLTPAEARTVAGALAKTRWYNRAD